MPSAEEVDFQAPAGHVTVVDGRATLLRDGEASALDENEPLLEGDRIETERGRVELLFADASSMSLDEMTSVEVLGPTFFRVVNGQVALTVDRRAPSNSYRVDASGTMVWIRAAGEFRILASGRTDTELRVSVIRGLAEVQTARDRVLVRAGFETLASDRSSALVTYPVPATTWTSFDRWVEDNERYRYGQSNTSYLPAELRAYSGVLDSNGTWGYEGSYGYVWYPRVDADWQPYSSGRWASVRNYGWTWIGVGRWAWPTHHYGRWGYSGARWYWIPGRRYAPAWVTWASAPGYVAWCPIGYVRGPTFRAGVSFSSWRGWSAVPARSFSLGIVVAQRERVPFNRISERFVVQSRSPVRPIYRANVARGPQPLPNTAQPRAGVTRAPRMPETETRATRGPVTSAPPRDTGRASTTVSPRFPSRSLPQESVDRETPRETPSNVPNERVVSPRFPSRSMPSAPSVPQSREAAPPNSVERGRPGMPERPTTVIPVAPRTDGYARSRRSTSGDDQPRTAPAAPSRTEQPESRSGRYRRSAPAREPAASPEPASRPSAPSAPSRPERVERPAPRERSGGTDAPSSGGGGRAVPRGETRGGSRGR